MTKQINFSDLEYSCRKRLTNREKFLDCMDEITTWYEIVAMIKPYYYNYNYNNSVKSFLKHYADKI